MRWSDRYPCLDDRRDIQPFDSHYVYHTAWAARILAHTKPVLHVDISSYLYFATLVSAFIPVEYYDYRPADIWLSNYRSNHSDLTNLPFGDETVNSLSCMHVVEHIGLGRYGDPVDPSGDLRAMSELKRVLAPGGTLLLVVPVGEPKVMFNAHRIYSYRQVAECFSDLHLGEFTLIPDSREGEPVITNAAEETADAQRYGCGCFRFIKPETPDFSIPPDESGGKGRSK
ncbi:MAG: DUF268 domain-containing protein [Thermovirgaceae bacterium]|nr:DUF268 domain-containing protein [Thermovirgaceae bacterium]